MFNSRTRRAISCVYCEPKSKISTLCCMSKNIVVLYVVVLHSFKKTALKNKNESRNPLSCFKKMTVQM